MTFFSESFDARKELHQALDDSNIAVKDLVKEKDYGYRVYLEIDQLLYVIFILGADHIELDEEEKIVVGQKLKDLVHFILVNLETTCFAFCERLQSGYFRKISAFKFLLEDFGDIMIDNKSLRETLLEKGAEKIMERLCDWVKGSREYVS